MRPEVIVYNAVSVDGRIDHGNFDLEMYYGIAAKMKTEAIVFGSETIVSSGLEDTEGDTYVHADDPTDRRPMVAIVDSRGRVRCWNKLRCQPYWRDIVALVSESTPRTYLDYLQEKKVRYAILGKDRVDMERAVEWLGSVFGAKRIRVDSGGTLNGVLLRQNLVSEIHLLVHPIAVGGTSNRSMFIAPDLSEGMKVIDLELIGTRKFEGGLLYLRYRVKNWDPKGPEERSEK
jgi:2,5-diamino-6-(ribosylamino)-4(3H)-pyrimidinone 5'-phosphate reductase